MSLAAITRVTNSHDVALPTALMARPDRQFPVS